ncbi:hypothetical protein SAMN05444410_1034 [Hydrobacter penzbergensis]|uniref:Uncharacterized protein n=1 Tax=Hydrobacter penzbergensis TaxID=1235997 RepID=A0A8X8IDZ3_9BACT|nr:hypothetical protein SAMN05444410_1034 [Hydrobacter penzbergensis]
MQIRTDSVQNRRDIGKMLLVKIRDIIKAAVIKNTESLTHVDSTVDNSDVTTY